MSEHPFAKDLGYLFPFFERVSAWAAELPEADAARLRALLEGEEARWREVAALLEGSAEAPMTSGSEEGERADAAAPVAPATLPGEGRGWTVGPLT